jgi:sodium/bile acid cotransporter 7
MASGLPMATALFAGHGIGLLVLPVMLFHQIQLMTCAWLAARHGRRAAETAAVDARSAATERALVVRNAA